MQDEKGKHAADDKSGQSAAQNGKEDILPSKRELFINAVEAVGAFIFAGVAVALFDAGFHIWGFFSGFLSVLCGIVILTHLAERAAFKYVKTLFGTLVFLDFILFAFLSWHTSSSEKPAVAHPVETGKNNTNNITPTVGGSITTLSPKAITDEISAVRPMQRDAIAKSFIGAEVRWLLNFYSVDSLGGDTFVSFRDGPSPKTIDDFLNRKGDVVVVCIGISDGDKNLLRLAEKDAPFYVSGTVSGCSPAAVNLSNCKLEPYSANTNAK